MPNRTGPVLVVDDDAAVRHALKFALELEGLNVRLYEDGAELLADAALPRAGCLVVDYRMPGMDGLQLVERLRTQDVALPALLITARPTADLRHRANQVGVREVIEKPCDDGALLGRIRSALAALS